MGGGAAGVWDGSPDASSGNLKSRDRQGVVCHVANHSLTVAAPSESGKGVGPACRRRRNHFDSPTEALVESGGGMCYASPGGFPELKLTTRYFIRKARP